MNIIEAVAGVNAGELAERLNEQQLPEVRYDSTLFTPHFIPGISSNPNSWTGK